MEQQICGEYMKTIDEFGFLTREEESTLAKKVLAGDQEARSSLICHNIALVINIASKLNIGNLEDRVQEGLIGLMDAIDSFDPSRGCRISTYAYRIIRRTIVRASDKGCFTIRFPEHLRLLQRKLYKVIESYRNTHGADPSYQQIERNMDGEVSAHKIEQVLEQHRHTRAVSSLDQPVNEYGTVGDFVAGPEWTFDDNPDYVKAMLGSLKPRHAKVVSLRFGLQDGIQRTNMEVARMLDISGTRVGQLLEYSIDKMRKYLRDAGDECYATAS